MLFKVPQRIVETTTECAELYNNTKRPLGLIRIVLRYTYRHLLFGKNGLRIPFYLIQDDVRSVFYVVSKVENWQGLSRLRKKIMI